MDGSHGKLQVLDPHRPAGGESARPRGHDYDEMFHRVAERLAREIAQTEREARTAGELLARLERQPPAARRRTVRDDLRYRSPVLVQALLARARGGAGGRPAFGWARLAWDILASPLAHSVPEGVNASLKRGCLLEMADALQRARKPGWALLCLHVVEADPGFGCDPDEEAKLCVVLARLHRDRRQRAEALRRYSRALARYAEINASDAILRLRREVRRLLGLHAVR